MAIIHGWCWSRALLVSMWHFKLSNWMISLCELAWCRNTWLILKHNFFRNNLSKCVTYFSLYKCTWNTSPNKRTTIRAIMDLKGILPTTPICALSHLGACLTPMISRWTQNFLFRSCTGYQGSYRVTCVEGISMCNKDIRKPQHRESSNLCEMVKK